MDLIHHNFAYLHPELELFYAEPGGFLDEIANVMVRRIDKALDKAVLSAN